MLTGCSGHAAQAGLKHLSAKLLKHLLIPSPMQSPLQAVSQSVASLGNPSGGIIAQKRKWVSFQGSLLLCFWVQLGGDVLQDRIVGGRV